MKENIQSQNLKHLLASDAWKLVANELEMEVERLTSEILGDTGLDPTNNDKKYTNLDLLRVERLMNKGFLELPQLLIEKLDPVDQVEIDT